VISEEGGCACSLLSDQADWHADAWPMRPEILESLARTLEILAETGPTNLSVEALWLGEVPLKTVRVTTAELAELARTSGLRYSHQVRTESRRRGLTAAAAGERRPGLLECMNSVQRVVIQPLAAERHDVRRTAKEITSIGGFQISVNGKPYCESEDLTALTMVVEEVRHEGHRISLHVRAGEAPVQWLAANLTIGDEIVIRVVDPAEFEAADPLGCSFCGRDVHDVSNVIQGPSAAICDQCIASFSDAVQQKSLLLFGASIRDEPEWSCGLCATHSGSVSGVIVRNGAAVCPECLRACVEIIADSQGRQTSHGA